jgi:hypothetical protein
VADRRLHRYSAASQESISGVGGVENVVRRRQKGFLHEGARFDTARLIVMAFGCRSGATTEQTGRDANVSRVVDRYGGGSTNPHTRIAMCALMIRPKRVKS